jgi:hypothetical protein
MATKNEFLLEDQQLIHPHIYLLDIFDHLFLQLPQKLLLRENVMYGLIQKRWKIGQIYKILVRRM